MVLTPDTLNPASLENPHGYTLDFVGSDLLLPLAARYADALSPTFIIEALAKGDQCFGVVYDGKLISFGWYSSKATEISEQLTIGFSEKYVYMYKGYTVPEYRGHRLHALGMAHGLLAFSKRGFTGLVSYVEANNFSSLKSCERLGYKNIGKALIARVGKRHRIYMTAGCEKHQFEIREQAALSV